ncbi:MAG TPA: hypothetical protein VIL35_14360 [Vicinamibacterales bacterium]
MSRNTRFFFFTSALILVVGLATGLLAYYGGLPTMASARSAGPDELKYVPASAAVVAYADVRAVMNSEFRQKLRPVLPHGEGKGQQEFQQKTGIDIEQDIDYVLAWMTPAPQGHPAAMVLLRGRFDQPRLEALAVEHGGGVEVIDGIRALHIDKGDDDGMLAFLEPGLIAVGEEHIVRAAIGARNGPGLRENQELTSLIADLEGSSNLWAVGRMDALASRAHLPEQLASQIPAVKWFAASSSINGGLSGMLRAEARDPESAKNLRDVIQGFMALARLQAGNKPELAPLLQSMQLSGTGNTVALSFEVPSTLIDAIAEHGKRAEN